MAESIPAEEQSNYETFRDCMSEPIMKALAAPMEKPKPKKKRHAKKGSKSGGKDAVATQNTVDANAATGADAEDLGEFIEVHTLKPATSFLVLRLLTSHQYLSALIFPCLPLSLRTLTHALYTSDPVLQETYSTPLSASTSTSLLSLIPPTALDSLESYGLLPSPYDPIDLSNLLIPPLTAYITAVTAPPPIWSTTRTSACELCARDWVPLTYHHLIPKAAHARVLKRGWHTEDRLNSVAWLCRACHSFVHGLASNEELARRFYTVELIVEGGEEGDVEARDKVAAWVKWVGGVRWKSR
ncbi:hypothetical protein yc1106_00617 [Curvularia clavata]|uniref:Uncharacterized protein n=1 Tax=Curvularia clavata TaxID=95742 RepID=A0A9Q9DN41_CURCL|nr:hypothetical protein yc1106_00617 [Curvularia clavata]